MRKEFADKPVVFIAVNSGNPKSIVEEYAKSTGFEWPILVDELNETEKQFGIQISLQNIYQWFILDPEGKRTPVGGDAKRAHETITRLLPSAKLLFEGITIPEKLKPLARDIETGQYEPGVAEISALAQKAPKDLQEAAKAMYEKLKPLAEGGLERAKSLEGEGKKYLAYVEYAKVAAWFKKTEYEKTATAALSVLKKDKEVQDELTAKQMLDQAKGFLASSKKTEKATGQGLLAALLKKYPATEAGKEAARLSGK